MKSKIEEISYSVAGNILSAERCRILVQMISKHAAKINSTPTSEFFAFCQSVMLNHYCVNLVKIFEPQKVYPMKTIPALLDELRPPGSGWLYEEKSELAKSELKKLGITSKVSGKLKREDLLWLESELETALRSQLPSWKNDGRPISGTLNRLRIIRDKVIAHQELIDPATLREVLWDESQELLALAKDTLGTVGRLTSSTEWQFGGKFTFDIDFQKSEMSLLNLLQMAHMVPADEDDEV
jgi:hypothetical protein